MWSMRINFNYQTLCCSVIVLCTESLTVSTSTLVSAIVMYAVYYIYLYENLIHSKIDVYSKKMYLSLETNMQFYQVHVIGAIKSHVHPVYLHLAGTSAFKTVHKTFQQPQLVEYLDNQLNQVNQRVCYCKSIIAWHTGYTLYQHAALLCLLCTEYRNGVHLHHGESSIYKRQIE